MRIWRFAVYAILLTSALVLTRCAQKSDARPVTVKGSDTMVILVQRWAEQYMGGHPGAVVQVTGGGSGTGIAALINGTTDICQSSRPMKDEERAQMKAKFGRDPSEILVARDGLAVYVNEANPLTEITLAQARAIYQGETENWKAIGGSDAPILLYSRENNSGTYAYFKEHVLDGGDFSARAQTLPGTAAVVNAVSKDVNGIGYGGDAYAKGVKMLALKRDDASPGVMPTDATIHDGSYPLARGLFYYLRGEASPPVKAFIDHCLSVEGQKLVAEVGYFPIAKAAP
ncbi:MAG: phosphate ABC transporter substrate-binding protein [Candidatus Eisenbacteria bacterium]